MSAQAPLLRMLGLLDLKLKEAVEKAVDDELDDEVILVMAKEVPVLLMCERMKRLEEKLEEIDSALAEIGMGLDMHRIEP